jgi:hypothetical protein
LLNEIFELGTEKLEKEFSIERLLINMRETRLFLKEEGYLTKELQQRL